MLVLLRQPQHLDLAYLPAAVLDLALELFVYHDVLFEEVHFGFLLLLLVLFSRLLDDRLLAEHQREQQGGTRLLHEVFQGVLLQLLEGVGCAFLDHGEVEVL